MRVIAGTLRSRILQAPAGMATRPTSDRLRETLFNVLARRIEGARFLDLYAGTGAVGIEALSRGAAHVVFVEKAQQTIKVLRANLEHLGLKSRFRVVTGNVGGFLGRPEMDALVDVVFLDPPYDHVLEYAEVLRSLGGPASGLLADHAVVVAEHRRKESLDDEYGNLRRTRLLQQGDAALSFYALAEKTDGQ
jgi:16S rRNA (guanine(966)-N(2))-methyltransferase RsmD